jgi:hypothetical protein
MYINAFKELQFLNFFIISEILKTLAIRSYEESDGCI